jgi:DNA invertase Pin-like site-specific DNA recombinase
MMNVDGKCEMHEILKEEGFIFEEGEGGVEIYTLSNQNPNKKSKNYGKVAICYIRKSSDKQASIPFQASFCMKKARENGYSKAMIYYTTSSAWDIKQIERNSVFKRMLTLIKENNIEEIYIYDISRFMRNMIEASNILKKYFGNVSILSVSDGREWIPGKSSEATLKRQHFLEGILDSQKFSDTLSMKIRQTRETYKNMGIDLSRAKYGFKSVGKGIERKMLIEEKEMYIVHLIRAFKNLNMDEYTIVYILNSNDIGFRGDKEWKVKNISDILSNPKILSIPLVEISQDIINDMMKKVYEIDWWILCDECKKWRKVDHPTYDKYKSIKFECNMLTFFYCNVPQAPLPPDFEDFEEDTVDINQLNL